MDRIISCPLIPNRLEESPINFGSFLFDGIQNHSKEVAVDVYTGVRVSHSEFLLKSEQLARNLLSLGCRQGDVVAIFSPNSIEWLIIAAAIWRIDALPAGINPLLTANELKHMLSLSRPKIIYTDQSRVDVVFEAIKSDNRIQVLVNGPTLQTGCLLFDNLVKKSVNSYEDKSLVLPSTHDLQRPKLNDPCLIMFSSGTTGLQKAVQLSHTNLLLQIWIWTHQSTQYITEDIVAFSPFSHIAGIIMALNCLCCNYTCHVMTKFDFNIYLKSLNNHNMTNVFMVPPVATLLAKSPEVNKYKLNLRSIACGAAPLGQEVEDQLRQRFPGLQMRQIYGLTETTGVCVGMPLGTLAIAEKPGSIGVPQFNTQLKVIDIKTGLSNGPNESGELCVKSPLVMVGYISDPKNNKSIPSPLDKDGWFRTGDIAYYDSDGYFYVVDRIKELIKYNAYQVAPAELEAVILSHPGVADAAVIGIPDAVAGELPMAVVVRQQNSNATETEIYQFVEGKVASYKKLRGGIKFVETIPKTLSGKILRRELRKALLESKL